MSSGLASAPSHVCVWGECLEYFGGFLQEGSARSERTSLRYTLLLGVLFDSLEDEISAVLRLEAPWNIQMDEKSGGRSLRISEQVGETHTTFTECSAAFLT